MFNIATQDATTTCLPIRLYECRSCKHNRYSGAILIQSKYDQNITATSAVYMCKLCMTKCIIHSYQSRENYYTVLRVNRI